MCRTAFSSQAEKKSSVEFYFEEIELSEEEINAFKLLGQENKKIYRKQIGNAVPPNFAKTMFSQILSEMTA